ncbi:MAG TPA: CoA ester lyase [Bacilli bacterium]|jgi:citrate lyase subunit beta/citryl-CoA lyase|nr:CoA ester lyase [Bacilli bacterium]
MRRSMLFIPGNNPAMLQNADCFESDAVIIDLEDAVHINEKDNARNLVHYYLESLTDVPMEIVIRINAPDTPYYEDDLKAVVSDKIDAVMLPKAGPRSCFLIDQVLTIIENEKKMQKKIGIVPIIETTMGVMQMEEIAKMPRVSGILLGAEDLSVDMEVERTKTGTEIWYPRAKLAYTCKAYKIDAIDTPFTDTTDYAGLKEDALKAKALGLNAKAAIHPNQIDIINQVFSPSEKQIIWAKRVLKATEEAQAKNLGVFSLDGKMVDKPIIDRAQKIIKMAQKYHLE